MTTMEYITQMTVDEVARWICLLEGIDVIFAELEENDLYDNFEQDKRLFNKIDRSLIKYINERYHTVRSDLILEYGKF